MIAPRGRLFRKYFFTILALVSGADRGSVVWATVALVLCLAGDVALLPKVDKFVVGLGSFLLGHLAFIGLFVHRGEVVDGAIVCPFHGLRFATDGRCLGVPSLGVGAKLPDSYRVRSFPTVERYGLVWTCLGDATRQSVPELPVRIESRGSRVSSFTSVSAGLPLR